MISDAHQPDEVVGDRFRLIERLGGGAFAAVWRAHDGESDREVAVKILYDRFRSEKKVMQRFAQEAQLLSKLIHPNVARAIAWSVDGDRAFLAMEYLPGVTVGERISAQEKLVPLRGVSWFCDQVCAGVAHAHARGIVHRDLKPSNVMMNRSRERPFLKVLDFGIAKVLGAALVDPTTAGCVLGSVLYLAPEQIRRGTLDFRSDIFAIATMVYEFLTLRRAWARGTDGMPLPFTDRSEHIPGNNQFAVMQRIAKDPRPRARDVRPDVPPDAEAVLVKGMAIEPEDRYGTAAELAFAFRQAIAPVTQEEEVTHPDPLGLLETLPEVRIVRR